jgi:prevent-host-death family protein
MCYMSRARVQIRELRQNLSKYVRRVVAGESLEVTDRGRPVAMLVPLPEHGNVLEQLVAEGRVIAPRRDLRKLGPPTKVSLRTPASRALREQRRERKFTR